MTIIYIAGPMTGISEFNFPAFNNKQRELEAYGYVVLNPAAFHTHTDATWEFYLRYAIQRLAEAQEIYMLPGWSQSRGASLEHHFAKALGMRIHYATLEEYSHAKYPKRKLPVTEE